MERLKDNIKQAGSILKELDIFFAGSRDILLRPLIRILEKLSKSFTACETVQLILENSGADCLVLNFDTPHIDMKLVGHIRKHHNIPLVIISYRQNEEAMLDLINIGVDKFIPKPVDNKILMETLESVAHMVRRSKETRAKSEFIGTLLDINPSYLAVVGKSGLEYINQPFKCFLGVSSVEQFNERHRGIVSLIAGRDSKLTSDDELGEWILEQTASGSGMALQLRLPGDSRLYSFLLTATHIHGTENKYLLTFTDITSLETEKRHYQYLAEYDSLTAIFNRSKLSKTLDVEITRVLRYGQRLSVIMIDIDRFKGINDRYGHLAGDSVLVDMAKLFKEHVRRSDILGRYGGEEFMILMPSTSVESAAEIAERLRLDVSSREFSPVGGISISAGVTEYIRGEGAPAFIKRADDALYTAKRNGRDRVEVIFSSAGFTAPLYRI